MAGELGIMEEIPMHQLNEKFGIENRVLIDGGKNGLPKIDLIYDADTSATVYLQGAHLTSWRCRGSEFMFLSSQSQFSEGMPIRGGIPIAFPQFGLGDLPPHGFARNLSWSIQSTGTTDTNAVEVSLLLSDSDQTREMWDHPFQVEFTVTLDRKLQTTIRVSNTGSSQFTFKSALHTYFSVTDIANVSVGGLKGTNYIDSLKGGEKFEEKGEKVTFDREVDRIYLNTPDELFIEEASDGKRVDIYKTGFPDAVVWNPWTAKAKKMPDFGDGEFTNMVCVEAGAVGNSVVLEPSEIWKASQKLSIAG